PLADDLSSRIGQAQETLRGFKRFKETPLVPREEAVDITGAKPVFNHKLRGIRDSLQQYRQHLDLDLPQFGQLGDRSRDREALGKIAAGMIELEKSKDEANWLLDPGHVDKLHDKLSAMRDEVD